MTNYTMFDIPGTPLSCAAEAVATARRGTGMRWLALGAFVPRGRKHVFGSAVVETAAKTVQRDDAVANGQAYVRLTADLPTIKQFRVPLSLRERSS
jgi:hypothetical protein